jgi:hypothetical protein
MSMNGSVSNIEDLQTYASQNKISVAHSAVILKSPLVSKAHIWDEQVDLDDITESSTPKLVGDRDDLLTLMAKNKSSEIQFPSSTIFLHGLGCIASALTKAFCIEYGRNSIPVNLYVATGQPPSTGKSEVNNTFVMPIIMSYEKINKELSSERKMLIREIARIEKQLGSGKDMDERAIIEMFDVLESKQERLKSIPIYKATVTDATPEAAEILAMRQSGMFNILSAEAESINVMMGSVYGDNKGGKKTNQGLMLSAWDGEYISVERAGRETYTGFVRASISVLAQPDTIDTILEAGSSGRGLTERFLILVEPSMLGNRIDDRREKFNTNLYRRYENLIENILREEDVKLNFSADANDFIRGIVRINEPKMADDGEYSNALLTGVIGKADKQIRKIAAVLHCIENWQDGGERSRTIGLDETIWACSIFDSLSKTFVNAADSMGYVGNNSEMYKMVDVLNSLASSNKLKTTVAFIVNKVKNSKPFKGSRSLTKKLKIEILPELQKLNYCILDGQNVYINPRLK